MHLVEAHVRVGDQVELVLVVAAVVGRDEREGRARRAAADVDAFAGALSAMKAMEQKLTYIGCPGSPSHCPGPNLTYGVLADIERRAPAHP